MGCSQGAHMHHWHLPPDNEVQLRQFPSERHPGHHETHQGQRRQGDCL